MKPISILLTIIVILSNAKQSFTQNVGIGTAAPTQKLHILGTVSIEDGTQGNGKILTSDAAGNASWQTPSIGTGWLITGNSGTTPATNFIGTIDNQDFVTRTNNIERMRVTTAGNVGIGTSTPITQLHIPGRTPTAPVGTIATGANPFGISIQGRYVFTTNQGSDNVQIFDVSNPSNPVFVSSVANGSTIDPRYSYPEGRYLYVVNQNGNNMQIWAPLKTGYFKNA